MVASWLLNFLATTQLRSQCITNSKVAGFSFKGHIFWCLPWTWWHHQGSLFFSGFLGLDYSDLNLLEGFNSLKQMGSDRFVLSLSYWGIKHLSYFLNKCPNNGFWSLFYWDSQSFSKVNSRTYLVKKCPKIVISKPFWTYPPSSKSFFNMNLCSVSSVSWFLFLQCKCLT